VKNETKEGLESFRKRQEELEKAAKEEGKGDDAREHGEDEESWAAGRKRKRRAEKEKGVKGLKLRRSESSAGAEAKAEKGKEEHDLPETASPPKVPEVLEAKPKEEKAKASVVTLPETSKKPAAPSKGLLVSYDSDDDE
jgi:hypothetical protein